MNKGSLSDAFMEHIGTAEYNGVVADIQRWYYGELVRASWCATSTSYFMHRLGIIDLIGGKNENVCLMMNACKNYARTHDDVVFYDRWNIPDVIQKDDICFWLWNGSTMTTTSNKHVATCLEDSDGEYIRVIGGNQHDAISVADYHRNNLYAVYRYKGEKDYKYVGWHKDTVGWWYSDTTKTYLSNCWRDINGSRYYFNADGYAVTGLQTIDGKQYVFCNEPNAKKECALMRTDDNGALSVLELV